MTPAKKIQWGKLIGVVATAITIVGAAYGFMSHFFVSTAKASAYVTQEQLDMRLSPIEQDIKEIRDGVKDSGAMVKEILKLHLSNRTGNEK